MSDFLHVDGELVSRDERHLSALDRGFRYGDAVFETFRVYGGTPYAWERHLDRLERSAATIRLYHGIGREDLRDRVEETLAANELQEAYLRLSISRGVQPGTLEPRQEVDPTVVIQVEPLPRGGVEGTAVWDRPIDCTIGDTQRVPAEAIPAHIKSHNYLNGILATIEARDAGVDQAILLDADGMLTEATTANLFFVTDGVLHTPSVEEVPVLPGITREDVLELADTMDIPTERGRWKPTVLHRADEVFLTNTTWEVRPVRSIDDTSYPVGSVTDQLRRAYTARIERLCYADS